MDGKCTATNKDGAPCSAAAWQDDLCRWHHPALEQQRAEGRRKGGAARSHAARAARRLPAGLLTIEELQATVGLAIAEVRSGAIEAGVANSIAGLAKAYIAINEARAVESLEADVAALRDQLARRDPA